MMDGARVPAKHVVVGTAGHIDHGKTSLVKALTGTDTDRLPEEKARGITIDLGFAFLEEPDGLTIEIVDVPGHERFVKNMLAGVGGIDLAMLVIAADEGVMPQTREHLAICSLLHIRAGLIALTKADLVEPDWLELVREDVAGAVRATFLEGAPILPVSAKTGHGLDDLRSALRGLAESVPSRGTDQLPRLPIDRVFTVKGFGTVVTGTLTAGALAVDDRVEVYPRSTEAKIRGLQAHGHAVASAQAGQRTAVNLQGLERAAIARGDVVGLPGTLVPALLAALQPAGRVVAVDRDWFIHPDSFAWLRTLVVDALAVFHRANPLKPGMSREELRGRAGGADERVFAFLLSSLVAGGTVKTERDKVRLATHEVRLSPEQQRVVDRLEDDFLRAEAAPPSAEEALGRAGLVGDEEHELFQVLVQAGKLVRVKESLFFHTRALDAIQTKLVALLRERKEIGPADIKDLLGISRKYAIPLLEFFDQRRVTARVGERRILRAG